jgi:hypothetical protein
MTTRQYRVEFFWASTTDVPDESFVCDSLDPDNFSRRFLNAVNRLDVNQSVSENDAVVTRLS